VEARAEDFEPRRSGPSRGRLAGVPSAASQQQIEELASRIEALEAGQRQRAEEAAALPPLVQRIVSRIGDIRENVVALRASLEGVRQELSEVRQRQTELTAAIETLSARPTEPSSPSADELARQIDERFEQFSETYESTVPAALERLSAMENRVDSIEQQRATELPERAAREALADETNAAAANGGQPAPEDTSEQTPPVQSGPGEEGLLQLLRQETLGMAMASINDLYRKLDKLDRQEEALSRIINLIVERTRLISEEESQRERSRSRGRKG
jgi:prefoldin subunit 5